MAFGLSLFKDRSVVQYDPARVHITWSSLQFEGFAPDTFVTIEKVNPLHYSVVTGIDGKNAYLSNKNTDYLVTITLLSSSILNRTLLKVYSKFIESTDLLNTWGDTLTLIDHNLKISWSSPFAFFYKAPEVNYSAKTNTTTWQVYCNGMSVSNVAVAGEHLSTEQLLIKKVEETIQSVGKTISGIFS